MINYLSDKLIVMNNKPDIEQLFVTMMQFGKLMSQHAQESHEERTATMLQLMALQYLIEQPNGTVTEVGNLLELSKSSSTQLVERLVKAGLVKRIHDEEDRRIVRLNITENGKKEFITIKSRIIEEMQRVFSKIPSKDLCEFIRIQISLVETLKKEQNK